MLSRLEKEYMKTMEELLAVTPRVSEVNALLEGFVEVMRRQLHVRMLAELRQVEEGVPLSRSSYDEVGRKRSSTSFAQQQDLAEKVKKLMLAPLHQEEVLRDQVLFLPYATRRPAGGGAGFFC